MPNDGGATTRRRMLFSEREAVRSAIADPATVLPRIVTADNMVEDYAHWQTRAALKVLSDQGLLGVAHP